MGQQHRADLPQGENAQAVGLSRPNVPLGKMACIYVQEMLPKITRIRVVTGWTSRRWQGMTLGRCPLLLMSQALAKLMTLRGYFPRVMGQQVLVWMLTALRT